MYEPIRPTLKLVDYARLYLGCHFTTGHCSPSHFNGRPLRITLFPVCSPPLQVPIKVIGGKLYVRIAVHVYNSVADYQRLADAINIIIQRNHSS